MPAGGGGGGGGIGAQTKGLGDNNSAIAEEEDSALHKVGHARAASTNWSTTGHDRAAGVMRRLSLGGALSSTKVSPIPACSLLSLTSFVNVLAY